MSDVSSAEAFEVRHRLRRLHRTSALRSMVRETRLDPASFVLPLFVRSGAGLRQPIGSMPGCIQTAADELLHEPRMAAAAGVGGVMLCRNPANKDAIGAGTGDDAGPVR